MSVYLSGVNYLAVLVAAVATFFLGGAWYTALAKPWQRFNGYSDEQVKQMQAKRPPPVFFGGMLVSYLVLSLVVAVLFNTFGVDTYREGALAGFLIWLGPAAAIGFTSFIASDKQIGAFVLDAAYQLVFLVMSGAILGGWK